MIMLLLFFTTYRAFYEIPIHNKLYMSTFKIKTMKNIVTKLIENL